MANVRCRPELEQLLHVRSSVAIAICLC
jgi:hypothetical protein